MDCKDFQTYSSAYIDNELSEEEKLDFKNHIGECETCNVAFENLKIVVESVNMLEKVELPINFSNELHEKLRDTKNYKSKPRLFSKAGILSGVAATLLILVLSLSVANNFLNCKKGTNFYSGTKDMTQEENMCADIASDEAGEKTSEGTDDKEFAMSLKMAPAGEDEETEEKMYRNTSGRMREESMENVEDTSSVKKADDDHEKFIANKSIQSLLNDKNLGKIFNLVFILILIVGTAILIYKMIKR